MDEVKKATPQQQSHKKAKIDSPAKHSTSFAEDDVSVPKDALHKLLRTAGIKFGKDGTFGLGNYHYYTFTFTIFTYEY